jgi:hypothetical protein
MQKPPPDEKKLSLLRLCIGLFLHKPTLNHNPYTTASELWAVPCEFLKDGTIKFKV